MSLPANQLPVGEGIGPEGQCVCFYIDRDELHKIVDDGPAWKYDDARFIQEAVERPDAIFQDLGRHDHENSLCYSVRPTHDPEEPEAEHAPSLGKAFLVFVRPCVGGYLVFDWEWRTEDFDNPGCPENWAKDFKGGKIWPKT